ncbi:hypothetical protein C2869_06140 [Saccharobesus litoralis]|uniref:Uncharacterized protein n=1 Tax=Saccharobesus litoralis TaxID=2172099 RepID=A0A2S0VPC7_9ALTE|nr:hypothetical protein [Saccharobesus litoralis]AWB66043.1 hypothetical protein C2869_06140 [Saccharobesus litoralis]
MNSSLLQTQGLEFSLNGKVNSQLSVTFNHSHMDSEYINKLNQFAYFGAADLSDSIDPKVFWGGTLSGLINTEDGGEKGGTPDDISSLLLRYKLTPTFLLHFDLR